MESYCFLVCFDDVSIMASDSVFVKNAKNNTKTQNVFRLAGRVNLWLFFYAAGVLGPAF